MNDIDSRIVRLGIQIGNNLTWYDDYSIHAKGTKVSSSISSECSISITGLKQETQNFILKNCRPGQIGSRKRVTIILAVGRDSYGTAEYYRGDVFRASPTGRPDIGINLKCLVGYGNKRLLISRGGDDEFTPLSQIAKQVADDCGYKLSFEVSDRNIRSYSFTGSSHGSLINLEKLSNSEVYVDNDTLYVKNIATKATGRTVYTVSNELKNLISAQATESGVTVKMMFHPSVTVGSVIALESSLNPSINGQYSIYKLSFDVSKRSTEFYLMVEAIKYAQ